MKKDATCFGLSIIFLLPTTLALAAADSEKLSMPTAYEFRICFEGPRGRCFEGLSKPQKIRQYGGRTDSEASVSEAILQDLATETESVLKAAEALLQSHASSLRPRCTQPLKFHLRHREAIVCMDQLQAAEKNPAVSKKVLPRILALLDRLSLHSKRK